MKTIHKRTEKWDGFAFTNLEEIADFIAELDPLLEGAGAEVETSIAVATESQDYNGLTVDELRELSKALLIDQVHSVSASSDSFDQPVEASLLLLGGGASGGSTHFDVNGDNQVAVDGINVWGKKAIDERFGQIKQAEVLAAAKSEPHEDEPIEPVDPWWKQLLNHPWAVQIGGGVVAALIVAAIFLAFR
jgi:hypothetical protein